MWNVVMTDGSWEEINYMTTKKGFVRGGHYHKETKEILFIIKGEVRVNYKQMEKSREDQVGLANGEFTLKRAEWCVFEPNTLHTIAAKEDTEWITLLSKKFDGTDTFEDG